FNLLGPIGMCVDVNAGSVGIPLAQTGFIISGASGGFSFVNSKADPCAFSTYMDADGKPISNPLQLPAGVPPFPIAPMSWAQLRDYGQRFAEGQLQAVPRVRSDGTGELTMQAAAQTIPCPGDCPPATVNIFCQPHPDSQLYPGRIITKFTSIDEGTLNTVFGITEERIQNLLNVSQNIAVDLAHMLRVKLDETIPDPDPALGSGNVTRLRQLQTQTFDTIENSYRDLLAVSIGNSRVASVIYEKLRAIVYAGLPCVDVNFTVSGTMSHLAVSSFLSITGEGTLSTTGTAGVAGKVNLLGVPVGIGKVFVAATDAKGLPNPSICGDLHVAIGPLELGYLKAALKCDECVSGVLQIFANLVVKLSRPVIDDIIRHVAPQLQLPPVQADVGTFLNTQLSPEQKIAFMAELFQIAPDRLPIDLDQVLLTARDAVGLIIDRINPEMLMCGQVKPKLFGIPMGADYGTVQYRLNKFGRDATFSFSPSMMLLDPRMAALIPPADNATFGYSEVFPDFGKAIVAGLSGKLSSPQAAFNFAKDQFASMLENSTYTAAYELSPMGFKLARAAARAVNPDLTNHPLIRQPGWVHPDLRGQGLLSQEQILQASLRAQLLGNSLWKGNITDLAQIFPEGSPERTLYQSKSLSLTKDYFPYGGIIGAGYLDIPRAFYETVPQEFFTMIGATNQLLQRLMAGFTYVNDYVLKNTEAGTLSFYIPAPNPPAFQKDGVVLSPLELMQSLMAQDVQSIRTTPLYPLSEMFMQGEFHGKLLGVDVADAHMVAVLGDGNSTDAYFRVDAGLGQNAWVRQLVDQATFAFEIRQRPEAAIEKAFAPYVTRLQQLIAQNASDAGAAQTLLSDIENACINNMPKVSLEAALQNLHIPPALASYLAVDGSASATVYAYSPRFQPGATGDGPISEAKRRGGAALKANLKFGNYFSIPNAELAVFPRDAGLPEMRAHIGPVSANLPGGVAISGGTLDFNSVVPSIAVSGRISPINLGVFQIAPLSGADIGAGIRIANNSSGLPSTSISILPAQLKLGLLGNDSMQLRIQGATA
ncbi:MAG: hypothetical protein JWM99_2622, partial [Verrucomicrobiales bacterium]|nr:hypothetical protein [Verrucomicrobiales bacterium]